MAGRQRSTVCNKPAKCNLCFRSSAWLITGLLSKPSALNISQLQLAISKRKSGRVRGCWYMRLPVCQNVWVGKRGVEDLYSEGCSCSLWLAALMAAGFSSCEWKDPSLRLEGRELNKSRWPPLHLDHTEQRYHYTDNTCTQHIIYPCFQSRATLPCVFAAAGVKYIKFSVALIHKMMSDLSAFTPTSIVFKDS